MTRSATSTGSSRGSAPARSLGRYARYHAVVSPWLWFLTRTADCRIFQDKTVRQIVEEVFADHQDVADFAFELTESYQPWKYCVQYRETDFNFVSRLLEHEGMYYYFRQTDGHHTLVITDSTDKHEPTPGYEKLQYIAPQVLVRPGTEYISEWDVSREVQPGAYVHDDYDFERPSVDLTTTTDAAARLHAEQLRGLRLSRLLHEEAGRRALGARAHRRVRRRVRKAPRDDELSRRSGRREDHARRGTGRQVQRRLPGGRRHAHARVDRVRVGRRRRGAPADSAAASPRCRAASNSGRRGSTPKPFVQGPQTAVVVGPAGDEIYTDKYGRVKVQFHWDRRGKKDENSSCWVRVSHPWAGKGWGSVSTPRIGQEVIVDFLEGDPDQPIITGRVYNEECQPPFGFPAGAVISGIKSDTHKGGGYNELSMDDTAGKEQVTHPRPVQHGQRRSSTIRRDHSQLPHGRRSTSTTRRPSGATRSCSVGADQSITVGANRTLTVGSNQTTSIGSNESLTVGAAKTETIAAAKALTIGAAYQVSVGAAMNETIGGLKAEEIGAAKMVNVAAVSSENVGSNKSTNAGGNISEAAGGNISEAAGGNISESAGGNISNSAGSDVAISAGSKVSASAGSDFSGSAGAKMGLSAGGDFSIAGKAKGSIDIASELVIKCGGASIVLKSGGEITIKGTDITIEGSGKINVKAGGDIVMKGSKIKQN